MSQDYDEALTTYQHLLAMSEAHFQLGRALYLEGKKSDAIAAWKVGAAVQQPDFWNTRCAEAMRAAESGSQPLLD